ncbi:MAG: hypothetical protein KF795_17415, partial [Labilithrix sp.]|nr:hypothetical protein [Labilithrix sp.]
MRRPATLLALAFLSLTGVALPGVAHADGILPDATGALATRVDVRAAVAVSPFGSTRWSRVTVGGSGRALWLVPARPGAAIDWSADAWLEALDDATAVRVLPPALPAPCSVSLPTLAERSPAWDRSASKRAPSAMTVHLTDGALRDHVGRRGFRLGDDLAGRVAALYERGWVLVAFELEAPAGADVSSPTIRVSDDGAGALPFALTGGAVSDTRVTAFSITNGPATTAASEIAPANVVWGPTGSNYAARRDGALRTTSWLRESSSHDVLFDGVAVANEARVAPIAQTYFRKASAVPTAACESAARAAGSRAGSLGRVCARGAVAKIDGGSVCAPSSGAVDASAFACGSGVDDLALALSGMPPAGVFVTRFAGRVAATELGADATLRSAAQSRSPVFAAGVFDRCPPPAGETPLTPPPSSTRPMPVPVTPVAEPEVYTGGESCSGSTGGYYEEEAAADDGYYESGCDSGSDGYYDDDDS